MDPAFEEIALAVLGGAGGGVSQASASALFERLRERFRGDQETSRVLERGAHDDESVRQLQQALCAQAAADPAFREELLRWELAERPIQVNSVAGSQGVNAPGATFNGPITNTFNGPAGGSVG